jgi:hypothetical protein
MHLRVSLIRPSQTDLKGAHRGAFSDSLQHLGEHVLAPMPAALILARDAVGEDHGHRAAATAFLYRPIRARDVEATTAAGTFDVLRCPAARAGPPDEAAAGTGLR